MRQCVRVKHGYGKEYFFLAKHLYKAAVGNSAYVRGQADIQGTFGQRLFEYKPPDVNLSYLWFL